MTLLSMCQQVAREVGVPVPSTIIANNDENVLKMLAAAQTEGRVLASGVIPNGLGRHNWTALRKEHTFSTVATDEDYTLPSDFDRFVNDTWWDRSNKWGMKLVSPQRWQYLKSGNVAGSGIDKEFIKRGTVILIYPTPSAVETIGYEYMSTQWCESSGGTAQTVWTADTDVGKISEDLMMQGIKYRFLRAIGAPYADEQREYQEQVIAAMSADGGRTTISLTTRPDHYGNLPERGYAS